MTCIPICLAWKGSIGFRIWICFYLIYNVLIIAPKISSSQASDPVRFHFLFRTLRCAILKLMSIMLASNNYVVGVYIQINSQASCYGYLYGGGRHQNISLGAVSWSSKYMKSASKEEIELSKVTPWVSNEIPNRFLIFLTSFSQYNEYLWIGQEKAFVNEPVRVFII